MAGGGGRAGSRKDFGARGDSQPDGSQYCRGHTWPKTPPLSRTVLTIWPYHCFSFPHYKLALKCNILSQTMKSWGWSDADQVKSTLLDDIQKIMQEGDSREKVNFEEEKAKHNFKRGKNFIKPYFLRSWKPKLRTKVGLLIFCSDKSSLRWQGSPLIYIYMYEGSNALWKQRSAYVICSTQLLHMSDLLGCRGKMAHFTHERNLAPLWYLPVLGDKLRLGLGTLQSAIGEAKQGGGGVSGQLQSSSHFYGCHTYHRFTSGSDSSISCSLLSTGSNIENKI